MLAELLGSLSSWHTLPVAAVCYARGSVVVRVSHRAWEASSEQGVSMGMRYEMALLGVEERSLVDSRQMIVAMLGLHTDR